MQAPSIHDLVVEEEAAPGSVAFYTLGCKVNTYDTEGVATLFRRHGYRVVDFDEVADVYVINTCSVTNMAARKSRQVIHQAVKRNPRAIVVVMGCYAQYAPDEVGAIPGVDIVVGTHRRAEIVDFVAEVRRTQRPIRAVEERIFRVREFEELPAFTFEGRTRAIVKVQDGCNEFCTFCQIPWARGRSRSRRLSRVKEQVEQLAAAGFREVVVTGVHLGIYGVDLDEEPSVDLVRLLHEIHDTPGLQRIRLSSVNPSEVTAELIEAVASLPKVCPHLHIPAQSGDDDVLLLMRRRNTVREFLDVVERLRARIPDVAITTDVIVGFPGETPERFENTVRFCEEVGFSKIHVFPYSKRKGTLAERLPGHVPPEERDARVKRLLAVSEAGAAAYHRRLVGRTAHVLVEEADAAEGEGLTEHYVRARIAGAGLEPGTLVPVRITASAADHVTAVPLSV